MAIQPRTSTAFTSAEGGKTAIPFLTGVTICNPGLRVAYAFFGPNKSILSPSVSVPKGGKAPATEGFQKIRAWFGMKGNATAAGMAGERARTEREVLCR